MSLPEYNDEMSRLIWLQPTDKERLKKVLEEREFLCKKCKEHRIKLIKEKEK